MNRFILSPEAVGDLDVIWAHIAQDNPEAADRVIEAAYKICRVLAEHPELGRVRKLPGGKPPNIRSFVISDFPNYVIFYRAHESGVQIFRVLHGARNIEALFEG